MPDTTTRWLVILCVTAVICWLVACCDSAQANGAVGTRRIATGFTRPLYATAPAGDSQRLFVVEQRVSSSGGSATAHIKILDLRTGAIQPQPFLEVTGLDVGVEFGLLGMAFHPDYENNGYFYLSESFDGHSDIRRYTVSGADPNQADPGSATTILTYPQPHPVHNGNWIGFGPDGFLYHTSGDGGNQHDENNNAQNKMTLNGAVSRINVDRDDFPADAERNYAIPDGMDAMGDPDGSIPNPFVGEGGGVREELWAIGLRNPWRASFDSLTGDFYIGNTSQDTLEEVEFQHAGSPGGLNYGWPLREGTIPTPTGGVGGDKPPGAIDPIYEYLHTDKSGTIGSATATGTNQGNSITGGYVYRGPIESLQGQYFLGDFVTDRIWSIRFDGTADPLDFDGTNHTEFTDWTDAFAPDEGTILAISSFAEDALGNLYILDYAGGEIFKVVPEPSSGLLALLALCMLWAHKRRGGANIV